MKVHGDGNFSAVNLLLDQRLKIGSDRPVAAQQAYALRLAPQVAGSETEPAARRNVGGGKARERERVEFGQPLGGTNCHPPGEQGLVLANGSRVQEPCTLAKERRVRGEIVHPAEQIGPYAPLEHFALDCLGRKGHAHGNRLALADLVFENAQGLVEIGHQEIGCAVADGLFLRGRVGCSGERSGSGDVACHERCSAFLVEFCGVEQLAAEGGFLVLKRAGASAKKERSVAALDLEEEGLCGKKNGGRFHKG